MPMTAAAFRERLSSGRILVAPGVHDTLSALVLQQLGAEAAYVGGAAFSYGQLGNPDVNLATPSEMAEHVRRIRGVAQMPLLVDADTGFGSVLNVQRTARTYVDAGATAIQIEDQVFPKRCGHLEGRSVTPAEEMAARILAAQAVQGDRDFVLVARTDARTSQGMAEVIRRVRLFEQLGVDLIFPESLETEEEYSEVRSAVRTPLLANMVEGGRSPDFSAAQLQAMGYQMVIYPGSATRSYAKTIEFVYRTLLDTGTTAQAREHMLSFSDMQELLQTNQFFKSVDDVTALASGFGADYRSV